MDELRVATWNVQHAVPTGGGRPDPGALGDAAAALDVDVLALQEVDRGTTRCGGADLLAVVAEATGLVPVDGTVRPYGGGRYGNALLVRTEPSRTHRTTLPQPGRWWSRRPEVRGVVVAVVDGVRIGCCHLGVRPHEAAPQLSAAVDALGDGPAVLLGDLNLRPPAVDAVVALHPGWSLLDVPPAYPAKGPEAAIDHVLLRDLQAVAPPTTRPTGMSDHQPVLVTLRPA